MFCAYPKDADVVDVIRESNEGYNDKIASRVLGMEQTRLQKVKENWSPLS